MIDPLLSPSDPHLTYSLELLDSSMHPSKISTTDSSVRLIKRPVKLEIHKITQLDFLMISKSHNSLDEDEAHRKEDFPCLCHDYCMHFKRYELIISRQDHIKENSMNAIEGSRDYIKDDKEEQYNGILFKDERIANVLHNADERDICKQQNEEIEKFKTTQFLCDLIEENPSEFRDLHEQTLGQFNTPQDDEIKPSFLCKMKQDHINEKLLTFKQKKIARILSKNSRLKQFLEADFSEEDSEREEMSSRSNSIASFIKCNHARRRRFFLEDFDEEDEEEEEEGKKKGKEEVYLNLKNEVEKQFEVVLKEKESVNEFDLLQKYEFDDEIVGDGFVEEGEEEVQEEALIIRRLEVN